MRSRICQWRMYARKLRLNAPAERVPDPNEKLIKVFDSEQESEHWL